MDTASRSTVTLLLESARRGDKDALPLLFEELYGRLKVMAGGARARWGGDATLQTTALVHEAYLKIATSTPTDWEGRSHFLGVAAKAMRQILTDHARKRKAAKRGGGRPGTSLDDSGAGWHERIAVADEDVDLMLALDAAIDSLSKVSPRESEVVECRFYGGLTVEETAAALDLSTATVKRDWALAQAWLFRELNR